MTSEATVRRLTPNQKPQELSEKSDLKTTLIDLCSEPKTQHAKPHCQTGLHSRKLVWKTQLSFASLSPRIGIALLIPFAIFSSAYTAPITTGPIPNPGEGPILTGYSLLSTTPAPIPGDWIGVLYDALENLDRGNHREKI